MSTCSNGDDLSKMGAKSLDRDDSLRPPYPFFKETFLTLMTMLTMPMYSMVVCLGVYVGMLCYARNAWIRTLLLLYLAYVFLDRTPSRGIRWHVHLWRSCPLFKFVAQYFDMTLVKTTTLDASQNYTFLYHPHGIISMGLNLGVNTNGCGFDAVFPGISTAPVTLNETFYVPFFREWMLLLGFVGADKRTLKYQLQKERRSIVLVPGGAQEALHAHPDNMRLYLKRRKGFVRLALESKTPLVPIVGFGENRMYSTLYAYDDEKKDEDDHPLLWRVQQRLVKVTKFSMLILTNIIPRPVKVTLVVGAPLELPGTSEGWDNKTVDVYHAQYLQHLKSLYDTHKSKYGHEYVNLEFL